MSESTSFPSWIPEELRYEKAEYSRYGGLVTLNVGHFRGDAPGEDYLGVWIEQAVKGEQSPNYYMAQYRNGTCEQYQLLLNKPDEDGLRPRRVHPSIDHCTWVCALRIGTFEEDISFMLAKIHVESREEQWAADHEGSAEDIDVMAPGKIVKGIVLGRNLDKPDSKLIVRNAKWQWAHVARAIALQRLPGKLGILPASGEVGKYVELFEKRV